MGFGQDLDILTKEGIFPLLESFDICVIQAVNLYMNPLTPLIEKIHDVLNPKTKSMNQHHDTVNGFIVGVIQQRRKEMENGKKFDDLLWYFMQETKDHQISYDDQELRDIMLNVIVAARDTTAIAITYAIYSLITYPEAESKLLLEIEQFFPNGKSIIESDNIIETIFKMTYARAVYVIT